MRIGLVIALQGTTGLWGLSSEASAAMAAMEINNDGGILGEQIELVTIDVGAHHDTIKWAVRDALESGVEALVAMHPSDIRPLIASQIPRHMPYIYTPLYEGGEHRKNIFAIGETSRDLLAPGISWLANYRSAERWYLIGNDYTWPRQSNRHAAEKIRDEGGWIVGEEYLPFGAQDYELIFARLRAARPNVVVLSLLGDEAVRFNRAFAREGLAAGILRYSMAVEENILYAIGPENVEGLYVTSGYFSNLRSRQNDAFLERYHGVFGDHPPVQNALGESCYEGLHFLAALTKKAASGRADRMRASLSKDFIFRSARHSAVHGARRTVHFASAQGTEFEIVQSL